MCLTLRLITSQSGWPLGCKSCESCKSCWIVCLLVGGCKSCQTIYIFRTKSCKSCFFSFLPICFSFFSIYWLKYTKGHNILFIVKHIYHTVVILLVLSFLVLWIFSTYRTLSLWQAAFLYQFSPKAAKWYVS